MKMLRNEDAGGGDGGGGAPPADAPPPDAPAPPSAPESAAVPASPDSLVGSVFDASTGRYKANWRESAEAAGFDTAQIGYMSRFSESGTIDDFFKASTNLASGMSKKLTEAGENEFSTLSAGERSDLVGKIMPRPSSPEEYKLGELDAFKVDGVSEEDVGFYSGVAHEAGLTREQISAVAEKHNARIAEKMEAMAAENAEKQKANDEAVVAFYKDQWGNEYEGNKDAVEGWIAENLDPDNEFHKGVVHDRTLLGAIHQLVRAQANGQIEGVLPTGRPDASTSGGAIEQWRQFNLDYPTWQSSDDPGIVERGKSLARMAQRLEETLGRR